MINRDTAAVILAGGKSSRIIRAKALLEFDSVPLIVHLVCALQKLFDDIVIVAAPGQPAMPATVERDQIADQGPVG